MDTAEAARYKDEREKPEARNRQSQQHLASCETMRKKFENHNFGHTHRPALPLGEGKPKRVWGLRKICTNHSAAAIKGVADVNENKKPCRMRHKHFEML